MSKPTGISDVYVAQIQTIPVCNTKRILEKFEAKWKMLGGGGYGTVYEGITKKSKKAFARKLIMADTYPIGVQREELQELMNLMSWNCPFVLQGVDVAYDCLGLITNVATEDKKQQKTSFTVILPLAENTLKEWLQDLKRRLPQGNDRINALKSATFQILLGLEFLHSQGIIHGDLKPLNILNFNGYFKLADFGLSRVNLTNFETGEQTLFTASHRAPEIWFQERKNIVSHSFFAAADIWAWGIILLECFVGSKIFARELKQDNIDGAFRILLKWIGMPPNEWLITYPKIEIARKDKNSIEESYLQMLTKDDVGTLRTELAQRFPNRNDVYLRYKKDDFIKLWTTEYYQKTDLSPCAWKEFLNLCYRIFTYDPVDRISLQEIKNHPFYYDFHGKFDFLQLALSSTRFPKSTPLLLTQQRVAQESTELEKSFMRDFKFSIIPMDLNIHNQLKIKITALYLYDRTDFYHTIWKGVAIGWKYAICLHIIIKLFLGGDASLDYFDTLMKDFKGWPKTYHHPVVLEALILNDVKFRLQATPSYLNCALFSVGSTWLCLQALREQIEIGDESTQAQQNEFELWD